MCIRDSPTLVLIRLSERVPAEVDAAEVGDVLALCRGAVHLQRADGYIAVVLLDDPLCTLVELLLVGRRPPGLEISLLVELTTFVVEAMRDLVTDRRTAGVRVHDGVIYEGVSDPRQNEHRGGENNLVVRRIVVCVVGLWGHVASLIPSSRWYVSS